MSATLVRQLKSAKMLPSQRMGWRVDRTHSILRGCVGWWPLWDGAGNEAVDISPSKNKGTLVAGTTNYVQSIKGTAFNFTGSQLFSCGDASELELGSSGQQFAISCWIKPNSSSTSYVCGKSNEFRLRQVVDTVSTVVLRLETIGDNSGNSSAVQINEWSHVVANWIPGVSYELYVNGTLEQSPATTDTSSPTTNAFTIGGDVAASYDGLVQNVRILSRILTASEVNDLYTQPWLGLEPIVPTTFYTAGAAPPSGLSIPIAAYHYNHHLR